MRKKPLVLIIMDGWGESPHPEKNAIKEARTPVWDKLTRECPYVTLEASGENVGLPDGQMGNSEVGHLNMGAGRIVYQQLTRIDKDIREKTFFRNPAFLDVCAKVKAAKSKLHLMGLVSDGGVHSHMNHIYALLELAKEQGIKDVFVHAILDGRDTPPRSAEKFITDLENKMKEIGYGKIATVSGRYYTMDRDKRWERILPAYKAYTEGTGVMTESALEAVQTGYSKNENDEFVTPTVILEKGKPVATIDDNDGMIFFNFRPDRARQITEAFTSPSFNGFVRNKFPKLHYVCMSQYDKNFGLPVAYPVVDLKNIFSEVVSAAGLRQLRIAETEKYAHVTFFFNGQIEKPFPNEDRVLIDSPKVATYDLQPEMSAYAVTGKLVELIERNLYDVIILNYANCDMVGHTGIMEAAIKAVETVDTCVGEVLKALDKVGGEALITADHGNAEQMIDPETKKPHTAHTTNSVPFIYYGPRKDLKLDEGGILADVAPTMLELLEIKKPAEMEGRSLIKK
jgi:2,3-bisphosphoglycerate-independent phosphoglycerate mutase